MIKKDKKTKKYYVRVSYKHKGKYKTKSKFGFDTKKEAEIYEAKLKLKADNDFETDAASINLVDYFEEYIETYKEGIISDSTMNKYYYNLELVREYFREHKKLTSLRRSEYQAFLNWRGKDRGKDTTERTHHYIKALYKVAMADGLIKVDPTFNAVIRYDKEYDDKVKAWSKHEATLLNQYFLKNQSINNIILYIMLNTGLRLGEVMALSYDDITKDAVHVKQEYNINYKKFTPGKNKSSIKTIVSSPKIHSIVSKYKLVTRKNGGEYPFLDLSHKPLISYNGLKKHLDKVCEELSIKKLTVHSLRHTHCSILLYEGMNLQYVSKRLGHSTQIETMKTYSHIIDEIKQREDGKIKDVLNELAN